MSVTPIRSFAKWTAVALLTLSALVALLTLLFEDQIGQRALLAVRGALRTELAVEAVSLSLWRDFPYASVRLEGVRLGGYPEGEFVTAEHIAGRIGYYDLLFAEELAVETVEVAGAKVSVVRDAEGRGNWLILAPSGDTSARKDFGFALRRILLDDVDVTYLDDAAEVDGSWHVTTGELAGRFGNEAYTLRGAFDGTSHYLEISDLRYLPEFAMAAELTLDIDPQANTYTFGPSTATLDGMPVGISGVIGFVPGATDYDLEVATDRGRLGPLLRALPAQWVTPSMRALDTRGAFTLAGSIDGLFGGRHTPAVELHGGLADGSLTLPSLGRAADHVSFALDYTNGKGHSMRDSRLSLGDVRARLDGQALTGGFVWTDFDDPYFDITAGGRLPLSWLDELWPEGQMSGELEGKRVRVRGRQRHLTDVRYASEVEAEGQFAVHRAQVTYLGERFDVSASDLLLQGADLSIAGAIVAGLDDTFTGEITLAGLVPYLFGDGTQVLSIDGEVFTEEMDVRRWVNLFTEGSAEAVRAKAATGAAADRPLATTLAANFTLNAEAFTYGKVRGRRFRGSGTLADSRLRVWGETLAMEGYWEVDGEVELRTQPRLAAKLACSEVNVHELFEQTDDVGQAVLEARHIEGEMTARAFVEAAWDAEGSLRTDDLHVWANVGLTDGELRDFEMLQALSRYVRSDELRHIRFTDTENWIEVDHGRVYLPAMFIQTTATNFIVTGEHGFDQRIDYAVRLNGAQVALTKLFGKREGVDFLPDRRNGWAKVALAIAGTLENEDYDVRLSGGAVRRKLASSLARKRAIRSRLTGLFGEDSLIDDYDDAGERRSDRPGDYAAEDDNDGETNGAAAEDDRLHVGGTRRQDAASPGAQVSSEYIDWDDEWTAGEAPGAPDAPTAAPALSGAPVLSGAKLPDPEESASERASAKPAPAPNGTAAGAGIGSAPGEGAGAPGTRPAASSSVPAPQVTTTTGSGSDGETRRPAAVTEPTSPATSTSPPAQAPTRPQSTRTPPSPAEVAPYADELEDEEYLEGFDDVQPDVGDPNLSQLPNFRS